MSLAEVYAFFGAPLLVAGVAAGVYYVTGRQDRRAKPAASEKVR